MLTIFNYDFNKELIYDSRYDLIGDLIGATTIFEFIRTFYGTKISWIKGKNKRGNEEQTQWYTDFNIFDWINLPIYKYYSEVINDESRVTLNSFVRGQFYIWKDLKKITEDFGWYPRLYVPGVIKQKCSLNIQKPYITVHILNNVTEREEHQGYISRRSLDFKKYKNLCLKLAKSYTVVRLGAGYDRLEGIKGIIDLTDKDLSLNESFKIISESSLFIGGDTGLKLAASALGIPIIIEVDDLSRKINGLAGCRPDLLRWFKKGIDLETLYRTAEEIMNFNKE